VNLKLPRALRGLLYFLLELKPGDFLPGFFLLEYRLYEIKEQEK
jgi:hypothetical protein